MGWWHRGDAEPAVEKPILTRQVITDATVQKRLTHLYVRRHR